MKRHILFLVFFCAITSAQAQDFIVLLTGQEISAKVTEITLTDILYQTPDSLDAPQKSISRQEVFMVKFANGAKELMQSAALADLEIEPLSPQKMAELGRLDARRFYNGSGALWGSAGSILVLGLLGPIIIAAVPPKVKPNEVSNPAYLSNNVYITSYKKQAHKMKVGKAAVGGAVGIGTVLFLITMAVSGMH